MASKPHSTKRTGVHLIMHCEFDKNAASAGSKHRGRSKTKRFLVPIRSRQGPMSLRYQAKRAGQQEQIRRETDG